MKRFFVSGRLRKLRDRLSPAWESNLLKRSFPCVEVSERRALLTAAMPGDVRQDILTVPTDGSIVTSTFVPEAGKTYHQRGSGTTEL